MIANNLQRHPFLRLLMPLAGGIVCGDATFFGQRGGVISYMNTLLGVSFWWLSIFLFGLALVLISYFFFNRWRWLYGMAVFVSFFGLGAGLADYQLRQTEFSFPNAPVVYRVKVVETPEVKERSILCRVMLPGKAGSLKATLLQTSSLQADKNFLLYFPKDSLSATLRRGDELLVHSQLSPPTNNGNPDEFDYERFLLRRGGSGTGYVPTGHWQVAAHDSSRTLRQVALDYRKEVVALYRSLGFAGDNLAVLSALTVGDKDELSEDIIETYSVSGASHVLALSGLHIGILSALLLWMLHFLWLRQKRLKLYCMLFVILLLWAFAFLTGLSPSVIRSVTMFSLLTLSLLLSDKVMTMNTLAATAFLMLLFHPLWLFDVGFQLSFSAVVAILLIQPKLYSLLSVRRRIPRYVWSLLTVSVAAQIGTAPLVIFYFSRFSTHFLLTNLWVIPMTTLVLCAAVLLLVLTPIPFLQYAFAWVVNTLLNWQNGVLREIEHLPNSSVDGIWIDRGEVLLLYLCLFLLFRSFSLHTVRAIYLSLFGLLGLVSYHTVSGIVNSPQCSIYFYNVRGCPAVHCLAKSGQSWLACTDILPDVPRLQRALSPHWSKLHLPAPQVITTDYSTSAFSSQNQLIQYAGKCICLLYDARWRNKTAMHPLNIDYLYISKGYKGTIEELTPLFQIQAVVVDASLSEFRSNAIKKDCLRLDIPYVALAEQGALCIPLSN